MSAKRITRVTLDEARRMESLTNWERVDRLTDEEIAESAANDPDTVHPDDPWWRRQLERGGMMVPRAVRYMQDVERDRREFEENEKDSAAE